MSTKWFCNNCHSLNARGARKCYGCGQREDYLGLDAMLEAPDPKTVVPPPSPRGPGNAVIVAGGAADGVMQFADSDRRPRPGRVGRTSRRGLAAITVSALVLVGVISTVAVLGMGAGPGAALPVATASPSPQLSVASTRPAPGKSPSTSTEPGASPEVAASPFPAAPASIAAAPSAPLASGVPADVERNFLKIVSDPLFSAHADMGIEFEIDGAKGSMDGVADFAGKDVSTIQRVRAGLTQSQDDYYVLSGDKMYQRISGDWKRVYTQPNLLPWDVFDALKHNTELGTPVPATGVDVGLWVIPWTSPQKEAQTAFATLAGSGNTLNMAEYLIVAQPDGTPVRVFITIKSTVESAGRPVTFNVSATWYYTHVGEQFDIQPPTNLSGTPI